MPIEQSSGDFIFKSLLVKSDLNPFWEKWREVALVGSVMCALIPLCLTLGGLSLNCVANSPVQDLDPGNASMELISSAGHALYINSACSMDRKLQFIRYSPLILFAMIVVIFLTSSFWFCLRDVAKCFRSFNAARTKLLNLDLTKDEMKRLGEDIIGELDREDHSVTHRNLRRVCRMLAIVQDDRSTALRYTMRKRVLLATLIYCAVITIAIYVAKFRYIIRQPFQCQLPETLSKSTAIDESTSFSCVVEAAKPNSAALIAFIITLVMQICFVMVGHFVETAFMKGRPAYMSSSANLMVLFWRKARTLQCEVYTEFVSKIFLAKYKFIDRLSAIFDNNEVHLIEAYVGIFGPIPEMITFLCHDLTKRLHISQHNPDNFPTETYIRALKTARYSINDKDTRGLFMMLSYTKQWKILVSLLENSDLKEGVPPNHLVASLKVPLDELDLSFDRECFSVLYYAFQDEQSVGPVKFAAAKMLCKWSSVKDIVVLSSQPDRPTPASENQAIHNHMSDLKMTLSRLYPSERVAEIFFEMGWAESSSVSVEMSVYDDIDGRSFSSCDEDEQLTTAAIAINIIEDSDTSSDDSNESYP